MCGVAKMMTNVSNCIRVSYKDLSAPTHRITSAVVMEKSSRWEYATCQIYQTVTAKLLLRIVLYSRVF